MKYLDAFRKMNELNLMELDGDLMIVEEIKDTEYKTKSNIIIAPATDKWQVNGFAADRPAFFRVLAVGDGYYDDETKRDYPVTAHPGEIVLLPKNAVKIMSAFGKLMNYGDTVLGLARESEIQIRFSNEEAFEKYFSKLNEALGQ